MGCGSSHSPTSNPPYSPSPDPHLQTELSTQGLDSLGSPVDLYDRGARPGDNTGMLDLLDKEAESREDEVMRPYLAAIKEPSRLLPLNQRAPNVHLKLEYVYGYSSVCTRQSLFYTANPAKVVYPASAVGVVLDTANNTQRFFGAGKLSAVNGHSDSITALAIHPNRDIVATGDSAPRPKICIWHSADLSLVKQFYLEGNARGVVCLSFSPSGRLLAACDLHDWHYVRVYDWAVGVVLAEEKTGIGRVLGVDWGSEGELCTTGVRNVSFWSRRQGGFLQRKGVMGDVGPIGNYTCVGWVSPELCITGGTDGFLYSWHPPNCLRKYPVCPSPHAIHCLSIHQATLLLGCSDRKIHMLDQGFREVGTVQVQACPSSLDMVERRILCGCRDGAIVEVRTDGRQVGVYMESHCGKGVWGLAVQTSGSVLTVGDDNKLKIWNSNNHKCTTTVTLEPGAVFPTESQQKAAQNAKKSQGTCIAVSPNGHIAIGHGDGHIVIRQEPNSVITSMTDSKGRIQAVSYSPSGDLLAAASHDSLIYLYSVASAYALRNRLAGHSAPVLSLDYSEDSLYLHSTSLGYDLLFWDLSTGLQLPSGSSLLRDEEWATWTALLGYPIRGIHSPHCDLRHINTVDRMGDGTVVAVGTQWGLIELFGCPNAQGARAVQYRGHAREVVAVRWGPTDGYLFSIGGGDNCLMQWARSL